MFLLEKIFLKMLALSETGALVILAVLFLRCLLYKMPKKFSYILWVIPAIRLLVPISFQGFLKLPERVVSSGSRSVLPPVADAVSSLSNFDGQTAYAIVGQGTMRTPEVVQSSLWFVLACLWLAGMVLFAVKNVYDYSQLRKKLCICVEWKNNIYLVDGITQPFVFAGFPCKIYLPSELREENLRYILMHEQVHVKRGDAFFKLLASVICCIHWFNPFVWLGIHYFNRDMEMSCDETVSAGLNATEKRAYALELLYFSTEKKGQMQLPCAFGEKGVKGRIMNLLREKRRSMPAFVLAGAVVVLAAAILLPDFRGMEEGTPRASAANQSGMVSGKVYDLMQDDVEYKAAMNVDTDTNTDFSGLEQETMLINGVPVSMRWQAEEFSGEEMETLAALVYDAFSDVYLSGDRRPDQMYSLDSMSYDFEVTSDLLNIFSGTENPMVWRLFVTLPDDWREDKGMGMMQDEESQEQEYDIALAKNAAGEWEVAESAWRVYYDSTGSFRWPE